MSRFSIRVARLAGMRDEVDELVEAWARERGDGVHHVLADLRDWRPDGPVDVLVTNATLQWVPDHLDLLPRPRLDQLVDLVPHVPCHAT